MSKYHRSPFAVRLLLLTAIGLASSACCFDGRLFGHHHHHGGFSRHCAPIRVCR